MLRKRYSSVLLLLLGAAQVSYAQGDKSKRTVIEIGSPDFRAYPVAIPSAKDLGGAAKPVEEMTEALQFDLDVSPLFRVLDPKSYLADQTKEGITAQSIKFSDWVSVGAEGLVKMTAQVSGNSLKTEYRFFDVATGKEQLKKSYEGGLDQGGRFSHKFADEIVFFLTGQRGIFNTQIAAVKKTDTGREIYAMDIDGKNRRDVTANGSINLLPAWSRNGREIVFTSYIRHNPNLYSVGAGGGGTPKLLSGERGLNTGGVMSPDGTKIALTLSRDGNPELYTYSFASRQLTRLTYHASIDTEGVYSPDGRQIYFTSDRGGGPQIYRMSIDGGSPQRVTFNMGNYNSRARISADGKKLALVHGGKGGFGIGLLDLSSNSFDVLSKSSLDESPSFAPNGDMIIYATMAGRGTELAAISVDGRQGPRMAMQRGEVREPAWGPFRN